MRPPDPPSGAGSPSASSRNSSRRPPSSSSASCPARPADSGFFTPPVDIEETDDAWIIEAELPGVSRKDVNVEVRDDELAIVGEIKERERKGILRRRTRSVGRYEFRVTLPGPISADDLSANLSDGVLTVRVPKPEPARARRIDVQTGERNGG